MKIFYISFLFSFCRLPPTNSLYSISIRMINNFQGQEIELDSRSGTELSQRKTGKQIKLTERKTNNITNTSLRRCYHDSAERVVLLHPTILWTFDMVLVDELELVIVTCLLASKSIVAYIFWHDVDTEPYFIPDSLYIH